ncbi:hypothetical protein BDZ89DRAFT_1233657 [Hymenopellis radicata]|nr:hypothetical protein BDZ89DRAFT_1233657 [Hymenopellis radicata]
MSRVLGLGGSAYFQIEERVLESGRSASLHVMSRVLGLGGSAYFQIEERVLESGRISRLQAVARKWTARRQIKKVLNRAIAARTIQRNARIYGELRDWAWWKLYPKIRPLLAAARNDDELRQKEMELALIRERSEREKIEKQNLENLKMSLEAEKRKVDEELAAEPALALDKDALLQRTVKREAELEEELTDLQADAELLDSQLTRAMKLQKEQEEKNADLRQMFYQAADHLVCLESEQKLWVGKESELSGQLLAAAQEEIDNLRREILALEKATEDLKALREQDLARAHDRNEVMVKELQGKLDIELKTKELLQCQTTALETQARQAKEQLAELARTTHDDSNMIEKKDERIAHLAEQIASGKRLHAEASQEIGALRGDIDTLAAELEAEQENGQRSTAARAKLQEELDELRRSMEAK